MAFSVPLRSVPAAIAVLAVVALGACLSPSDGRDELNGARKQFTAEPRPSYSFTWQESCFCSANTVRATRISVINDTVVRAVFVDDGTDVGEPERSNLKTIAGVFDMIQRAIDQKPHEFNAVYDGVIGYPRYVDIDLSVAAADDKVELNLSEYTAPADPTP